MTIKKKYALDYLIIGLMLLQLLILGYFGYNGLLNRLVSVLILYRSVGSRLKNTLKDNCFICLVISMLLFVFNCIITGFNSNTVWSNMLMILYPMLYTFYFYELKGRDNDFFNRLLRKGFYFFNIWLLINFIVISIQMNTGSMIAVTESNFIDFTMDLISGLFYYGGTHCLATYITFVVILNFNKISNMRKKWKRNILFAYNAFLIIYSAFLSTLNDNKSQILLLAVFLIAYFFIKQDELKSNESLKYILRISALLIVIITGLTITSSFVPELQKFYENNVIGVFDMFSTVYRNTSVANGSDERIAMVLIIFTRTDLWLTGLGMGSNGLYDPGILNFRHFGQATLGTLLILGGIPFTISIFLTYTKLIKRTMFNNLKLRTIWIVILLLTVTFYNQCFFTPALMTCTLLSFLALNYKEPKKKLRGIR